MVKVEDMHTMFQQQVCHTDIIYQDVNNHSTMKGNFWIMDTINTRLLFILQCKSDDTKTMVSATFTN